MIRPILVCFVLLPGCSGPTPAPSPREIPNHVWDVSPEFLTRDIATAKLYAGYRVRLSLAAGTYLVVKPGELTIPAQMPGVDALIRFHCLTAPVDNKRSIVLVGVCREPVRDGIWRTHRADFYVAVDECVVIDVLGPTSGAASVP